MAGKRIYLAAQYERAAEMRRIRDWLVRQGHVVTSRWIDQRLGQDEAIGKEALTTDPGPYRTYAYVDMGDIIASDVVVVFTSGNGGGRGGYHTELGFALGRRKKVVIVGPRENVFHTLLRIQRYPTVDDLIAASAEAGFLERRHDEDDEFVEDANVSAQTR